MRAAHVKLALDTGFSRDIVDIILTRLGWAEPGLLDATVASDEVAHGRPQPDLIVRAMALSAVTDARLVAKVGDTPADLEEGSAAGCGLVIGISGGSHTRSELSVCPHTHLVDSLAELLPIVMSAQG